ncbi:hypothetical protein HZA87_04965 [Candidatus Uhrbacteria bacterium]|nr:hypothetical protein [Candidatus Uhrbacteria bacterium]
MEYEPIEPTTDNAMAELAIMESALYATGAVDVEISALARIRHDLQTGRLSSQEAITKARAMMEARSDYH